MLLRLKREFANGQLKKLGEQQAEVHLQLEDGSEYASAGTLQFAEVTVDSSTGSVTFRSIFSNHDGLLLHGLFMRETIQEGVSHDDQKSVEFGKSVAVRVDIGGRRIIKKKIEIVLRVRLR